MKVTNATNKNLLIKLGNELSEEPEIEVTLRMKSTKELPLDKFNLAVIEFEENYNGTKLDINKEGRS